MKSLIVLLVVCVVAAVAEKHCTGTCQQADSNSLMNKVMPMKLKEHEQCVAIHQCPTDVPSVTGGRVRCVDGEVNAGGNNVYDCRGLDLMSFVSLADMNTVQDASDIWGWTDPAFQREIALVCVGDGTVFVDVTIAEQPNVLAFMKATDNRISIWHDLKVFDNLVYVGSESLDHGLQVYRLTDLRKFYNSEPNDIASVEPLTTYKEFGSSHNIVLNEDTGFVYAVGSRTCNGGLHVVDVRIPDKPEFVGCFADDGYTHDAQCVNYYGPDERYYGKEICFNYNEDSLTIVDVSHKRFMKMIAREEYLGSQYTHQGWLNEAHTHLLMNDELDELQTAALNQRTRTMVWDVTNLEKPVLVNSFLSSEKSIDHNLYIRDGLAYESNYCAGLRVLEFNADVPQLEEVMFFDTHPEEKDEVKFEGTWSNYPYFKSGNIVVNDINRGLFVLRPSDI